MSKHNNGGPAFPSTGERAHTVNTHMPAHYYPATSDHHPGMSLRDYFAAKAMQGVLASHHNNNSPRGVAKMAYKCADAMLAAREEGKTE